MYREERKKIKLLKITFRVYSEIPYLTLTTNILKFGFSFFFPVMEPHACICAEKIFLFPSLHFSVLQIILFSLLLVTDSFTL